MFSAAKYLFTTLLMVTPLVAMSMEWSGHAPKMLLSQYGFFEGDIADLSPAEGVVPYSLNSPLFSDYAHKLRFVKLPAGSRR